MGMLMLLISHFLGSGNTAEEGEFVITAIFRRVVEAFADRAGESGLLIMFLGGYVSYMKKIKASHALTYIAMQPLSVLKKHPYIAAICVIPIGQLLFLAIPSAVCLGLLLMATVYPILINLGVSRLTAVSIITACTVFDIGITSANSEIAAEITEIGLPAYFLEQIKMVAPLIVPVMIVFYFSNQYFDRKDRHSELKYKVRQINLNEWDGQVPLIYGILPALPIILIIAMSGIFPSSDYGFFLETSSAVLISLLIAGIFDFVKKKDMKETLATMNIFRYGMGRMFITVILLLVSADIFTQGIIEMGVLETFISLIQRLGINEHGMTVMISVIAFIIVLITGSGVAAFTAFGNVIPDIAFHTGIPAISLVIPIQLISGIARAASPIAMVIIATAEVAGVSPMQVVRRNIVPTIIISIILLIISLFNL